MALEKLKYPIGKYIYSSDIPETLINDWIKTIDEFPLVLKQELSGISNKQLETPYRQDGWTVRQVINHLADSHTNAFVRFHLALTEENPTIKPYAEAAWAELPYLKSMPHEVSVDIISSIHERWTYLLKSLSIADFARTYVHPEHQTTQNLSQVLGLYAWHCKHHLAHIKLVTAN